MAVLALSKLFYYSWRGCVRTYSMAASVLGTGQWAGKQAKRGKRVCVFGVRASSAALEIASVFFTELNSCVRLDTCSRTLCGHWPGMGKLLLKRNLVTVPVPPDEELGNFSYFSYSYHYTERGVRSFPRF